MFHILSNKENVKANGKKLKELRAELDLEEAEGRLPNSFKSFV